MNHFRKRLSESISEEELIAFHLHELPKRREKAVRRALESQPALALELVSISSALAGYKEAPMTIDQEVLDRNWNVLRPSLSAHLVATPRFARMRRLMPLTAGAAFAFLFAGGALLGWKYARLSEERKVTTEIKNGVHVGAAPQGGGSVLAGPNASQEIFSSRIRPRGDGGAGARVPAFTLAPEAKAATPESARELEENPAINPSIHLLPPARIFPEIAMGPSEGSGELYLRDALTAPPLISTQTGRRVAGARRQRLWPTTDVTLGVGGMLVVSRTSGNAGVEQRTQSATHAIQAVGSFHEQFRPRVGYRLVASYARPNWDYTSTIGNGSGSGSDINSRIFELAATYVVEGPRRGRLRTSGDVGGGVMAFIPTDPSLLLSHVYRGAGVLGVSVDFALTKHLGAKLSYRAQVFKGPDFAYGGVRVPLTTTVTVSNEPSLGITYRFGKDRRVE